jgi:hypothetical protein
VKADADLSKDEIAAEIARVTRLRDARQGAPGYMQNVIALNERLAVLAALLESTAS